MRVAAPQRGSRDWKADAPRPHVDAIDPATRAVLAEAWLRDALLEHASIASFSRFALELLAVGAPSELVDAAHEAARDEVRHARACFALASAYAGAEYGPARFPFGGSVAVSDDLVAITVRAVEEGCIGETLATIQAAEALAVATDPAVRDVLAAIVRDEARHATLAFRFVAWAIAEGGAEVRDAVAEAFAQRSVSVLGRDEATSASPEALAAHGRVGHEVLRAAFDATWRETLSPLARALCAGEAQGHPRWA